MPNFCICAKAFSSSGMLLLAETSFKGLKVHMDCTHTHSYLMEIGKVFTHLGPGSVQALGAQESENGIKAI